METNPSANIYNKFNNYKKITRDLENETKAPSTKGLLSRDMSMKQAPMRKEYMPVIPSYQKGYEITDTPGISTKRSTRDSVTTYTGREIRRRNRDKKLEI